MPEKAQRNVFVVSEANLWADPSAASSRLTFMALALARQGVNVHVCSPGRSLLRYAWVHTQVADRIWTLTTPDSETGSHCTSGTSDSVAESRGALAAAKSRTGSRVAAHLLAPALYARFLVRVAKLADVAKGRSAVYSVPSGRFLFDWQALAVLGEIRAFPIYYELCELWTAIALSRRPPPDLLGRAWNSWVRTRDATGFGLSQKMWPRYTGVVAISTSLERLARASGANVLRVPILCDASRSTGTPRTQGPGTPVPLRLGYSGWLSRSKDGLDTLMGALGRVREAGVAFELHLWGPVADTERDALLHDLPDKVGIADAVLYHGLVPRETLVERLRGCDLLVLPRPSNPQTENGFSTKLAEYLGTGTPVLATRVSDNADYLADGRNALLVAPGDEAALVEKICGFAGMPQSKRKRLGDAGLALARKHFHFEIWGRPLAEFLFPGENGSCVGSAA